MENDAIILNDETVKEGHIIKVYNKNRPKFSNAKRSYYCIWVQKDDKEFPIMLTERELNIAIDRAKKNPEDIPQKSFITDILD